MLRGFRDEGKYSPLLLFLLFLPSFSLFLPSFPLSFFSLKLPTSTVEKPVGGCWGECHHRRADILQYVWVQVYRPFVKMLSVVKVTLAFDCCDETSPIHLLGFALKLDIGKVRSNLSYSCETIL